MKNHRANPLKYLCYLLIIFLISITYNVTNGQDSNKAAKKQRTRLSLNFFNSDNTSPTLEAILRTKVEGYYKGIIEASVDFYKYEVSEDNSIGSAITNSEGKASLQFEQIETGMITYYAVYTGSDKFKGVERDIEIQKAEMELSTEMIDSIANIEVKVSSYDSTGQKIPAFEVPVIINVRRLYGLLPVEEETETDEDGLVEIELPMDLPGDRQGNLTIVANVVDHDEFGNIEISKIAPYGVPLAQHDNEVKEIWLASPASNTSKVMMIMVNALLLGILAVIIYILYELFNIKKLGKIS